MTIPEGLEHFKNIPDDMCARLTATIYGLVQSARMFWKKLMSVLENDMEFKRSRADPCLLVKYDHKFGPILVCTYVDNLSVWGTKEGRTWFRQTLKKYFNTKESEQMTDIIGINIYKTPQGFILRQDEILDRLEKYFGSSVENVRHYKTPMGPQYSIICPKEDSDKVESIEQKKYQSGVGILNYLVKHTRPDLANTVRELSEVLDGATEAHMQDLYRAIKYALDTRHLGLPIERKLLTLIEDLWIIEAWSDSDYAGDRDTRKSVTG